MSADLRSINLDVGLAESDYDRLCFAHWPADEAWPVFRLMSVWRENPGGRCGAKLVSCGTDKESPVKDRYIQSGVNRGAHVRIVGRNLEGEPVVQRLDGQPLEWPAGHLRHVLDVPEHMLGGDAPAPTLLEAAREAVNEWVNDSNRDYDCVIFNLAAAVEREEAQPW